MESGELSSLKGQEVRRDSRIVEIPGTPDFIAEVMGIGRVLYSKHPRGVLRTILP
jgi:hypothetical protein